MQGDISLDWTAIETLESGVEVVSPRMARIMASFTAGYDREVLLYRSSAKRLMLRMGEAGSRTVHVHDLLHGAAIDLIAHTHPSGRIYLGYDDVLACNLLGVKRHTIISPFPHMYTFDVPDVVVASRNSIVLH